MIQFQKGFVIALVLCFLVANAKGVCNLPQPRLVCAEYFSTDAVVVATLTRVQYLTPKNEMDGYLYHLRVEKVIRGRAAAHFQIYEENSSARAAFNWVPGKTYLLFLEQYQGTPNYIIDGCGNSGLLSRSTGVLKEIEALRGRKGGLITGTISYGQPKASIPVAVRGNGLVLFAKSGKDGQFSFRVPAGHYSLRTVGDDWALETDFMSYESGEDLEIRDGGCAQVHLEASRTKR